MKIAAQRTELPPQSTTGASSFIWNEGPAVTRADLAPKSLQGSVKLHQANGARRSFEHDCCILKLHNIGNTDYRIVPRREGLHKFHEDEDLGSTIPFGAIQDLIGGHTIFKCVDPSRCDLSDENWPVAADGHNFDLIATSRLFVGYNLTYPIEDLHGGHGDLC